MVAALAVCLMVGAATAAGPQPSVAGTRWQFTQDSAAPAVVEFFVDGTLRFSTLKTIGHWKQDGAQLDFDLNNLTGYHVTINGEQVPASSVRVLLERRNALLVCLDRSAQIPILEKRVSQLANCAGDSHQFGREANFGLSLTPLEFFETRVRCLLEFLETRVRDFRLVSNLFQHFEHQVLRHIASIANRRLGCDVELMQLEVEQLPRASSGSANPQGSRCGPSSSASRA